MKLCPVLPLNNIVGLPGDEVAFTLVSPDLVEIVKESYRNKTPLVTLCQQTIQLEGKSSHFGVEAKVSNLEKLDGGKIRFKLNFQKRVEALSLKKNKAGALSCESRILKRRSLSEVEQLALVKEFQECWRSCSALLSQGEELDWNWESVDAFDLTASKAIHRMEFSLEDRLTFLEGWSIRRRAQGLLEQLERYRQVLVMRRQLKQRTTDRVKKLEKEAFLQEERKLIDGELGRQGQRPCPPELQGIREQMDGFSGPEEVKKLLEKDFDRLIRAGIHSPHASTIQDYLETLLDIPWGVSGVLREEWQEVEALLCESHFGLEKIKDRILRYLSVVILTGHQPGNILCLVGPPGVGKTSFARAIAEALDLPFVKKSLGGVRDESDIRGHRRTYIGAMPGRIVQGLRKAECMNPVFLLDEVDKMGGDHRGDPASALLEVLDPEENHAFSDHYIEQDMDLSKVFWVLTANSEASIPGPLRDRLEIVRFSGYTETEKLHIAKDYLCRRAMEKQGLDDQRLNLSDALIKKLIREYTREAGVRELGRRLSNLVQFLALEQLRSGGKRRWTLAQKRLPDVFGAGLHEKPEWKKASWVPGVMAGLAWTASGGTVMRMECALNPGKGGLKLTGKLGEVMQESAHTALTFLKMHSKEIGVEPELWKESDYHIHIPAGSVPKEGPSAGLGLALLIYSLMTSKSCRPFWAMTGEISLHGQVLAIGGVKEKLLAAQQHGFKGVILPLANRDDVEDIQLEELQSLEIEYVRNFWEAFELLF